MIPVKEIVLMFKINIFFVILLLSAITISAQTDTTNSLQNDPDESIYQLYINPLLNQHKLFLGQDEFEIYEEESFYIDKFAGRLSDSKSITELKLEMTEYLKRRQTLIPNYDLGDFGKYLGYAQTFAVVLMAIAHISKYGFK